MTLNVAKAFLISQKDNVHMFLKESIQLNENYTLYYSSDLEIHSYILNDQSIHLLGYAFHINQRHRDYLPILKTALNEELNSQAITVNDLNGSFVLVKVVQDRIEILADAAGFRSPYYLADLSAVSSHDFILAELFKQPKYKEYNPNMDYSRYRDIYKLVPSNKLIVNEGKERIFPNIHMKALNYSDILSKVKKSIKNLNYQLDNIDHSLILGITGGIDSKCSLAFTNQLTKHVKTFTYMKDLKTIQSPMAKKIYSNDKTIVNRWVKNIKIDHEFIHFDLSQVNQSYSDELQNITGTTFNHPLAEIFEERFKNEEQDVLQIRSVIFSNAKFDYEKKFMTEEASIDDIYQYIRKKQFDNNNSAEVNQAIDEYFDRTLLSKDNSAIILLDIFHIDSRMGNWHSQLVKETDRIMDFFNYINDRTTLNMLLQLPIGIRKNNLFHKDLINTYWPVLNFFEENSKDSLYDLKRNLIYEESLAELGQFQSENVEILHEFNGSAKLIADVDFAETHSRQYKVIFKPQKNSIIRSNYNKSAGKGYIDVFILTENLTNKIDIVDLYKGFELLEGQTYQIEIKFRKEQTTNSWKKAGTLLIK